MGDVATRLSVRVSEYTLARLDVLAAERGLSRSRLVRALVERALEDAPAIDVQEPSEDELLALLAERARQGNVAAIRSLLARSERADPRERALLALQALAEGRES
jgi:predicted transcriptional regulator